MKKQRLILSILSVLSVLSLPLAAQAPASGQWRFSKRNANGTYTDYGLTAVNGQAIGFTGGVPSMLTLSGGAWGSITGTLSSQTDLQTALDAKLATSTAASTYQPLDAGLTALAALADASGVLTNNGSGTLSYTATSTGGNTFGLDAGKIAVYGDSGEFTAASAIRLTSGPTVMGIWFGSHRLASSASGLTKTWTLPNVSGTLITNNDTGTVTDGMLAGSIAISKLAITGTPDGTKFLRDDGTWQTVSSGATTGANTFNGLQQFSGTTHAGLRLNNLTTTQRDAIATPAAGMVIWNTTDGRMQLHNGTSWTSGMVRLAGDTMTGALINSSASAASAPALHLSGAHFTGGTGTTNTPHLLVQPSSGVATNTGWSTSGTALGLVLPDASGGNFLQLRRSNTNLGTITFQGRMQGFDVITLGSSGLQCYNNQTTAASESAPGRTILLGAVATGLRMASSYTVAWSSNTAGSADAFSNNDTFLSRIGVGILGIEGSSTGGAIQLRERTAPSAPSADRALLWIEDNGSGKTRLMIQFPTGSAQQISIEP